jgi:hypothetical protein
MNRMRPLETVNVQPKLHGRWTKKRIGLLNRYMLAAPGQTKVNSRPLEGQETKRLFLRLDVLKVTSDHGSGVR